MAATFMFDRFKLKPSACVLCTGKIQHGATCVWLAERKSLQLSPEHADFRVSIAHECCAKNDGWQPMDPNQPTWSKGSLQDPSKN